MIGVEIGNILISPLHSYRILKKVGKGNTSNVYLAIEEIYNQSSIDYCIIKELRLDCTFTDGKCEIASTSLRNNIRRKDFQKEVDILSKLNHPHIVQMKEAFVAYGTQYIVLNYVKGENLFQYTKNKKNKCVSEKEAIEITCEVARILGCLHDRKILHLDIQPHNIMRSSCGEIVLIDFGNSMQYNDSGFAYDKTGIREGAIGYCPMEQIRNNQCIRFHPYLDVYSLLATFYFLLTGEDPPTSSINTDWSFLSKKLTNNITETTIELLFQGFRSIRECVIQSTSDYLCYFGKV